MRTEFLVLAATLALAFAVVWSMEHVPGLASLAGARPPSPAPSR